METPQATFKEIKDRIRQDIINKGHDVLPISHLTDGEIDLRCKTCHETATLYIPYHHKPLIDDRIIGDDYFLSGRLPNIICNELKTVGHR